MFDLSIYIVVDEAELRGISVERFDREWNNLYGEVDLRIGAYHWDATMIPELWGEPPQGHEIVTVWLNQFLDAILALKQGSNYAAFLQIDTTDTWIVFRKTHDMVTVSVEDKLEETMSEYTCFSDGSYYRDTFITEPNIPMVQRSGAVCEVPLEMVVSKIVSAAQLCQQDFLRINAALVNSRMYRQLSSKLSMIEI